MSLFDLIRFTSLVTPTAAAAAQAVSSSAGLVTTLTCGVLGCAIGVAWCVLVTYVARRVNQLPEGSRLASFASFGVFAFAIAWIPLSVAIAGSAAEWVVVSVGS